jgi:hypothetical protein
VVAKGRERLAVSKQAAQKFDVEGFNLRKLSELEVRKQYQIKIPNKFTNLENLSDSEDLNRAREDVLECQHLSQIEPRSVRIEAAYTMLCWRMFRYLDQRKQAKMQWLQDPNQTM